MILHLIQELAPLATWSNSMAGHWTSPDSGCIYTAQAVQGLASLNPVSMGDNSSDNRTVRSSKPSTYPGPCITYAEPCAAPSPLLFLATLAGFKLAWVGYPMNSGPYQRGRTSATYKTTNTAVCNTSVLLEVSHVHIEQA